MIIIISGGVGSGKSLTAVRNLVKSSSIRRVFTNFKVKNIKNYYRLKKADVIIKEEDGKKVKYKLNSEFWDNNRNTDIFLDEMHNLISSRRSMTLQNQVMGEWIAQIRKLWGEQGDQSYLDLLKKLNNKAFSLLIDDITLKSNNIFILTQKVRKIDVNFRELAHVYIQCSKKVINKGKNKAVIIVNNYWFGDDNYSAIELYEMGQKPKTRVFYGNDYFKYYDSYEFVSMQGDWL
jgi:hypothetical protein